MRYIFSLPGPLLVFLGAFSLSFGGLIVKSFEGANLWQILFWRSLFFIFVVIIFLIFTYKKNFLLSFKKSGLPGIFGGIILSSGFCGYVFAMYNTTVANTNFIIQTQTIFLAIFGYFLIISIKIAKEIGITNAAILPVICPLERSDPTIKIIPDIAKIIDAKVTFEIFSFKKK